MFTIVCLGDSITCEWTEPHYPTYWQHLCRLHFGQGKVKIIAAGVNGETAADGYLRLNQDVLAPDPDLITIMFGHNDIHLGIPPIRFQEHLARIIDYLQDKSAATLWLLSPNRVADNQIAALYQPYLQVMKSLADDKHLSYIDLWSIFAHQNLAAIYPDDYLHPTATGHRLIAKHLFRQLSSLGV